MVIGDGIMVGIPRNTEDFFDVLEQRLGVRPVTKGSSGQEAEAASNAAGRLSAVTDRMNK